MIGGKPMHQLTETERKWFNQIQAARSSGLTDWEWCQQNNIPTSTFYYHIRKLRNRAADLPATRSTVVPETHEVVKLEICDDEQLLVPSASAEGQTADQNSPAFGPCNGSVAKADFSARLQIGDVTVDFSNSACDRIILSVINALRQSC